MKQVLFEVELKNLLAELNRALIDIHKHRAETLTDKIQDCMVDLWGTRMRNKL